MTLSKQSDKLSHPFKQWSNKFSQQQSILHNNKKEFMNPTRFELQCHIIMKCHKLLTLVQQTLILVTYNFNGYNCTTYNNRQNQPCQKSLTWQYSTPITTPIPQLINNNNRW